MRGTLAMLVIAFKSSVSVPVIAANQIRTKCKFWRFRFHFWSFQQQNNGGVWRNNGGVSRKSTWKKRSRERYLKNYFKNSFIFTPAFPSGGLRVQLPQEDSKYPPHGQRQSLIVLLNPWPCGTKQDLRIFKPYIYFVFCFVFFYETQNIRSH